MQCFNVRSPAPSRLVNLTKLTLYVLSQVFAVKARFSFPFGRSIIGNKYNFFGIIGGACLGMFIIYTPPLHVVFGGSFHLSPLYWLIPVAFGCLLLVWASIRVLLMRKSVEQAKVKDIKGLMMCTFCYFFVSAKMLIYLIDQSRRCAR